MSVILIVEDQAPLLILADSILESAGYKTLSASTFAQAQAMIESDQDLDLVFTDINLPDDIEAGIKVGQLVHEKRPGTPILYTSGQTVTDGMRELFVAPCEFLPKPYRNDELLEAAARLLNETNKG